MQLNEPFYLQKDNIYAIPIIHYNMEMAYQVRLAFDFIQPDCIAVELPETMQKAMVHAASRLPDLSIIAALDQEKNPLYYMVEPCDPIFEALRSAAENGIPSYCIDLDVDNYPSLKEPIPDPYAIHRLGLKVYFEMYEQVKKENSLPPPFHDQERELYMAKRLKELSFRYERILYISGMAHTHHVMEKIKRDSFPNFTHAERESVQLLTLTSESARNIMAEWGYLSWQYEVEREKNGPLDRQKLIFQLYKEAADKYKESTGNAFPGYHFRNIMKFVRNYSLIKGMLIPDLYKILCAAKGCVDHNYAYEVWELATSYPYRKNTDNLPELNLTIEEVWGHSKLIQFHLKEKGRKESLPKLRKDRAGFRFTPPNPFSICSYPLEDVAIEKFGNFLKKKGTQILTEESARSIPFSSSLEDGLDTKETIRHWHEKKLYVKARGKPPGGVGSVCMIFDEDKPEEGKLYQEKYPWKATWIGEHDQESDMSFYATPLANHVVGPGISRCEYGGFMMSYPPRRMGNIWYDPDYYGCRTKSEVLLAAAIDYAIHPLIVYVASNPPRSQLKSFARRFGKKIVYIPIGQLSPITINKLKAFHVLDGHDKRKIADEYIY